VDFVHDGYLPGDACANRPARDLLRGSRGQRASVPMHDER
jgi:hypothetical protein